MLLARAAAAMLAIWGGGLYLAASAADPAPTFAISDSSAAAGQTEVFTITRSSGTRGAYVLFKTHDDTALAGVDYTPVEQLIYVGSGVQSVTVKVPTMVNPAASGAPSFWAGIASNPTAVWASAKIVEPSQPTGTWGTAPLTVGGYACNADQAGKGNVPACGMGVVFKIIGTGCNGIAATEAGSQCSNPVYLATFYSDASKQFPAADQYEAKVVSVWAADQLQGLAPTP